MKTALQLSGILGRSMTQKPSDG